MTAVLLGLFALVAGVLLLKWYADADVKTLKKSVRWAGVSLLILIILILAATGRLGAAFAVFIGFLGWVWRVFNIIQMGRQMGGMFNGYGFGRGLGGNSGDTKTSQVESEFLSMQLDHETGSMDGQVLHGSFKGRRLSDLSVKELDALMQEVKPDLDSLNLMEAFLDRMHPEYRGEADRNSDGEHSAATRSNVMSDDEARKVLGVSARADHGEIKEAYRRLMSQLHPDRGGSDYLAAKVNQAKDTLSKH